MRTARLLMALALLSTSGVETSFADSTTPQVKETVPKSFVKLGDTFAWDIDIAAEAKDLISIPNPQWTQGEIYRKNKTQEVKDGKSLWHFHLEIFIWELGKHTISPLDIQVTHSDGTQETLKTSTHVITVGSVIGNEPHAAPKPPSKPVKVLESNFTLLYIAGGVFAVLLLSALGALISRWWSKRAVKALPPPPPIPAWQMAIMQLDELERERPEIFKRHEHDKYVDGVSDVLRDFIGRTHGFNGLESTSFEIVDHLRQRNRLVFTEWQEVAHLLSEADLIKFAKASASEPDAIQLAKTVRNMILRTHEGVRG